jgi:hypothetical protein
VQLAFFWTECFDFGQATKDILAKKYRFVIRQRAMFFYLFI